MAGLLDKVISLLSGKGAAAIQNAVNNKTKSFTFQAAPQDVAQLKALPEATLQDPYAVASLSVLALLRYESDPDKCLEMLNFLKGPQPLSNMEIGQIKDRMAGKLYKPRSFFDGATPENNYTPAQPLSIRVKSNPYSFTNEGWATLYLKSGGGDNERPVKLRKKPSTGQWFLNEIQYLGDIRIPVAEDKWA